MDGCRVRKWNVVTERFGRTWFAGDVVSCLLDCDAGEMRFALNGRLLRSDEDPSPVLDARTPLERSSFFSLCIQYT